MRRWPANAGCIDRDERGQVAFTFVLALIGFLILFALGVDAGIWYFDHRTAQNQVDAAALAAVQELPENPPMNAVSKAQEWLQHNGVDFTLGSPLLFDGPIPTGNDDPCTNLARGQARIAFGNRSDDGYHNVRVCVRRDSLVLFSGLAGVSDAVVSAGGTANVTELPVRYALMAMDPSDCDSLRLSGSGGGGGNLIVNIGGDGSTYTHDTTCANGALTSSGGAQLIANCVNPPGGGETCGAHEIRSTWDTNGGGSITPQPVNRTAPMPDPFEDVPLPTPGACLPQPPPPGPLPPGTYCDSVNRSSGVLLLSGGTYVFMNGLSLSSSASIQTAAPSLIYITCASAEAGGSCNSSQKFGVTSDPPSGTSVCVNGLVAGPGVNTCPFVGDPTQVTCQPEPMECLAIIASPNFGFDRNCIDLSGKGNFQIFGNIYAIGCTVTMSGQSGQTNELNATIVADHIDFTGQAAYDVNWNSSIAPKEPIYALVD